MNKYFFVIIFFLLLLSGCSEEKSVSPQSPDEKYYCKTKSDCVDGSYCEKTDDGCVGYDWWEKNVGYKYDCEPNPNTCKCVNNKCEKK